MQGPAISLTLLVAALLLAVEMPGTIVLAHGHNRSRIGTAHDGGARNSR
jgi:hypothetical protein